MQLTKGHAITIVNRNCIFIEIGIVHVLGIFIVIYTFNSNNYCNV